MYPSSHHHLHRPRGNTKLLRLPKSCRQNLSKARSKEVPSKAKAKSTWRRHIPRSQLRIFRLGTSISPTSGPLTPCNQGSNGMKPFILANSSKPISSHTTDPDPDFNRILPVPRRDESTREKPGLEPYRVRYNQVSYQPDQRILGRVSPTQARCGRSLVTAR